MAKIIEHENFRVEVEPQIYGRPDPEQLNIDCKYIADQIRRHVDDIAGVFVMHDKNPCCEYCGRRWTEDSDDYNGGCCDRDEAGMVRAAAEGET